jgi:flagellar hook protein FlgE
MAFANSLSGLIAASKALDVISNNIANSQTVGFKSSIARFTSISAAGKSGSAADTGSSAGVSADNIFQQLTQGKFQVSEKPLDMAISGLGFFRLFNPDTGKTSYTRDGQFSLSFEGNGKFPKLVSRTGLTVTGNLPDFGSDPRGVIAKIPAPVEIAIDDKFPPRASSRVALSLFLDSRAAPPASIVDPSNPLSYNGSATATVYDKDGGSHILRMYFVKPGPPFPVSTWFCASSIDSDLLVTLPATTLDFDTRGALSSAPILTQT